MDFSYEIVTDSSSNLQKALVEQYQLPVLPFKYTMAFLPPMRINL